MKKVLLKTLFVGSFFSVLLPAFPGEVEMAKEQLTQQLVLLEQISKHVQRPHLSRVAVLRASLRRVEESLTEKGLGHSVTIREYQNLIVAFRYSKAFFARARSEIIAKEIDEVLAIAETTANARGFDDSPYTQITASIYSQMHKLFIQLEEVTGNEELKTELAKIRVPMGEVIALGKQGDRLKTFIHAIPLYQRVKSLYPDFDSVGFSDPAFDVSLEIQGLNEFFSEFSQLEDLSYQEMAVIVKLLLDRDPETIALLEEVAANATDDDKELLVKIIQLLKEEAR